MDKFKQSSDRNWYYGGYVTVTSEEYLVLEKLAELYVVPDRILAGIMIRVLIRQIMEGTTYDFEPYIEFYKKRLAERNQENLEIAERKEKEQSS